MLKLDVAFIPEAHILKRWTRDGRDVLPSQLKVYQKDQSQMHSMTFRHRLMYVDALALVKKGDIDIELFEIVNDHLKKAHQHIDSVIAEREKAAMDNVSNNESDTEVEEDERDCDEISEEALFFHSDGEALRSNKYGASGSSSRMSDSEIMNLKAPPVKRVPGRQRGRRFMSGSSRTKKRKGDISLKEGPSSAAHLMSLDTSCALLRSCVGNVQLGESIGDAEAFFSRECYMKARAEAVVEAKAAELTSGHKKKTSKKTKDKKQQFLGGKTIQRSRNSASEPLNLSREGNVVKNKTVKKAVKSKCQNCGLLGHRTAECYTAEVTAECYTAEA
jgi:hypothetical protein